MSTLTESGHIPVDASLARLLNEVMTARLRLAATRSESSVYLTRRARRELRAALEVYTAALGERRLPVPYAVRDELRLLQHVPW